MLGVSVIMPNYNGGHFIHEAINSILTQTYDNFEFIIVDDCSTDNSVKIIQSFKDSRIRFFQRKSNGGIVKALNDGLKSAKYSIIVRMDSDDISAPNRISRLMDACSAFPDMGVISSSMRVIGLSNETWSYFETDSDLKAHLLFGTPISHPACLFNLNAIGQSIQYTNDFPHQEDYDLFYSLRNKTKFLVLKDVLYFYRIHGKSVTQSERDNYFNRSSKIHFKIIKEILNLELSDEWLKFHFYLSNNTQIESKLHPIKFHLYLKTLTRRIKQINTDRNNPNSYLKVLNVKKSNFLFRYIDKYPLSAFLMILGHSSNKEVHLKYLIQRILNFSA